MIYVMEYRNVYKGIIPCYTMETKKQTLLQDLKEEAKDLNLTKDHEVYFFLKNKGYVDINIIENIKFILRNERGRNKNGNKM